MCVCLCNGDFRTAKFTLCSYNRLSFAWHESLEISFKWPMLFEHADSYNIRSDAAKIWIGHLKRNHFDNSKIYRRRSTNSAALKWLAAIFEKQYVWCWALILRTIYFHLANYRGRTYYRVKCGALSVTLANDILRYWLCHRQKMTILLCFAIRHFISSFGWLFPQLLLLCSHRIFSSIVLNYDI